MESASLHMEGPLDAGQVLIFFQDELDLGMAEADLAYQLSAARPDIFEGCFVKEGRAAILLPSCEGICSCTLFAHLHLEIYYYHLWLSSWAKVRWPFLGLRPHWHLDQAHRSYRSSALLGDLVEVFYVASEVHDLAHVVARYSRDLALHVKVLQVARLVSKEFFYLNGSRRSIYGIRIHLTWQGPTICGYAST